MEQINSYDELQLYIRKQIPDSTLLEIIQDINSFNGDLTELDFEPNDEFSQMLNYLTEKYTMYEILEKAFNGDYSLDDELVQVYDTEIISTNLPLLMVEARDYYYDIIAENIEQHGRELRIADELILDYLDRKE